MPTQEIHYGPSFIEILGFYPAFLCVAVVALGVFALIVRWRWVNAATTYAIGGIACAGIGVTAWRLYAFNAILLPSGVTGFAMWVHSFARSWVAAGVVLPACGIGLILVGIAVIASRGRD